VIKADWLEAYRAAFDRFAPRRTGAEKRTARDLETEVCRLRALLVPVIKADWLEAYSAAFDSFAPRRTGAEKRTARDLETEVCRLRALRRAKRARTE
jgi:hypothetical protein